MRSKNFLLHTLLQLAVNIPMWIIADISSLGVWLVFMSCNIIFAVSNYKQGWNVGHEQAIGTNPTLLNDGGKGA